MRRLRTVMSGVLALGVLVAIVTVALAARGGDDDDPGATTPPASAAPGSSGGAPGAPPPGGRSGALPLAFVRCMKVQGFDVKSLNDIHSVPQQAFLACLGSLHGGGGVP